MKYEEFLAKLALLYELNAGKMNENSEIDKIDRKILQALQCDGRLSNLKLAEAVGLYTKTIGQFEDCIDKVQKAMNYAQQFSKLCDVFLLV